MCLNNKKYKSEYTDCFGDPNSKNYSMTGLYHVEILR